MSLKQTYYLVDYENTNESGLSGSEGLDKDDHIVLFYTENAPKISLEKLPNGNSTDFQPIKIPRGKQSLDMHLISYLGYLIGKNEGNCCKYLIISKDKDYDDIISSWMKYFKKNQSNSSIKRQEQIAITQHIDIRTQLNNEIQQTLGNAGYSNIEKDIGFVASTVRSCYEKDNFLNEVHNELRKKYPTGYLDVYNSIRPILTKYSKQSKKL